MTPYTNIVSHRLRRARAVHVQNPKFDSRKSKLTQKMVIADFLLILTFLFFITSPPHVYGNTELRALMDIKAVLDPQSLYLSSWTIHGDPCDSFKGVGCNKAGRVANISLQGKGQSGKLSPAIGELKDLTGIYMHYNSLKGEIPREIANLTKLSDLYLNVNNLSGEIPPEIGSMGSLEVLQLCYDQLTESIRTQLGSLKNLSVLALQSNQLTGAILASLGNLEMLMRLDLSYNNLFALKILYLCSWLATNLIIQIYQNPIKLLLLSLLDCQHD